MRPGSRRRLVVSLAAVALVGALALPPVWYHAQNFLQPLLARFTTPLYHVSLWTQDLTSGPRLARENEDLRRELATRLAQGAELDSVVRENQELRALNLIPPSAGFKSVGLEVVGRIQDEASTSYLVNRGSADGVRPGVAVVAGVIGDHNRTSALLVGTITQVASHTARFTLTTSSQSQVLAEVLNTAHSRGAAVGEYNLGLQLKFIPLADDVTVGQAVVTSNLDNLIPPGLLVGTVTNVEKHEGDFFLSATVAPPVNVDHFRFLEVLLPR